ncbi:uncharacterized protein LOC127283033 [Leptopilina boulardi]|uniref:uncharacterized protein LOC127283033 n=1 Tax=Leptopilina boulardi TaxID=63433 RepID=UPI0021F60505|nr:uncharacterized protein LOC127283033 [Leptopilina boulardi]
MESNVVQQILTNASEDNSKKNCNKNVYLFIIPSQKLINYKEYETTSILNENPEISFTIKFERISTNLRANIRFDKKISNQECTVTIFYLNFQRKIEFFETISINNIFLDSTYFFTKEYKCYIYDRNYVEMTNDGKFIDNNLWVCLKIEINDVSTRKLDIHKNEISLKFLSLYEEKILTDFKIICKDKEFCVHKAILICQCDVFRVMFEHSMKESQENTVIINDFEPVIVELMIRYFYSGEIRTDLSVDELKKLFLIANKYNLNILKKICFKEICKFIKDSNEAVDILLFFGYHNYTECKEEMVQFIKNNLSLFW